MSDNSHRPILWSTIEEYEGDPDVLARQGGGEWNTKPEGFGEVLTDMKLPEVRMRRRTFMKMSGFASVLAMAAGCQKPLEKILPYVHDVEEVTLGVPNYYASTCGGCSAACGMLVKTYEARPIKLEGNPLHPVSEGKLCSRGQGSLIELYDPDRLREPIRPSNMASVSWDDADAEIAEALASAGSRAVLLTGSITGPARVALLEKFKTRFPGLRHVVYEPLANEERLDAREAVFGSRDLPRYHFDRAEVTVLLGADVVGESAHPLETNRKFGLSRKVRTAEDGSQTMGLAYAFEPVMTTTGMNCDHRLPVKTSDLLPLSLAIANQLVSAHGASVPGGGSLPSVNPGQVEQRIGLPAGTVAQVAESLWAHRGSSLVYTGGQLARTEDSVQLHIAVDLINAMLGNEGETVDSSRPGKMTTGSSADILELIEDMREGRVDVLLVAGSNPSYSLPESAGFDAAMRNVALKVSFDTYPNETAGQCDMILAGTHYLESWGDAESYEGILSLRQPVIGKLWNNRQLEDSLIAIAVAGGEEDLLVGQVDQFGDPIEDEDGNQLLRNKTFHEFLRETWENDVFERGGFAGRFQDFWFESLRRGVVELDATADAGRSVRSGAARELSGARTEGRSGLELAAIVSPNTYDGRHANNPWLLELPDPVSKVSWDNMVFLAPSTARANRLSDGDIVRVTANGASIEGPVRLQPGLHPDVLGMHLGWGRTAAGAVGDGEGFNVFSLGRTDGGHVTYSGSSVSYEKTGRSIRLADSQGHNYMQRNPNNPKEYKRAIVQSTSLDLYNENPAAPQAGHHIPHWELGQPKPGMWDDSDFPYVRHKWVMAIDLNACTGCNACMVACQAENNVPVVGKREMLNGREMHWIRIDRYYKGDLDFPEVVKQPMLCQHCDNAPCETVCPVLATVHSDEGINQMVYNRCVGTRYCANNCPYKVRRFNFYQYSDFRKGPHHELRPDADRNLRNTPLVLALNPEITVRTKGIMEKCTFCQQRIRQGRYEAKQKGRNIPDGGVMAACQQTCPTNAISFGDALNRDHEVYKVREENAYRRGYGVLEEFNVRPNVMYLAHIWNRETKDYDDEHPYGGPPERTTGGLDNEEASNGAGRAPEDDTMADAASSQTRSGANT